MVRVQSGPPPPESPSTASPSPLLPAPVLDINTAAAAAVAAAASVAAFDDEDASSYSGGSAGEGIISRGGAASDHQPHRGPFFAPPSAGDDLLASSSLPSSTSPEGRLLAAAAENSRLRNALEENNVELRRQMQILLQWKAKIEEKAQEYNSSLSTVNAQLDELKKENQELKGKSAKESKKAAAKEAKNSKKGSDDKKGGKAQTKTATSAAENKKSPKQEQPSEPPSPPQEVYDQVTNEEEDEAPPAVPPHRTTSQQATQDGGGDQAQVAELNRKVENLESEVRRKDDRLAQLTAEKDGLSRELSAARADLEQLKGSSDKVAAEKWELTAANNELKNRLQQSMALSYMKDGTDTMLQEELHKMQVALAEERKVTEKLSRNLELEKRRVESMEQKLKSSFRKSGGGGNAAAAAAAAAQYLPEEVRVRDDQLASSMDRYRLHCDKISASLEECESKLASFEIQEDYHVADLRKELSAVKKMLLEERKRSEFDSDRFSEVQTMFGQVFKDYASTIDGLKQVQQKKKLEGQQQQVYDEIKENSYHEMTDNLTAKVLQAEEQLREERIKVKMLDDKLKKMEAEVDAIPILKAQVEVYQSDFNQEREAREKIAGEKADLEEELQKLKVGKKSGMNAVDGAVGGAEPLPPIGLATVRDRVNHMDDADNRRNNSSFDDF